jgi:Kef-type K+ transport system membrane component KefB
MVSDADQVIAVDERKRAGRNHAVPWFSSLLWFAALLGGTVALFLLIDILGGQLAAPAPLTTPTTSKLQDLVTVLLLPAFFAFTGMRTEIGLVSGMEQWLLCGLIILVATAGKFGGTLLSARLTSLTWRDAGALGLLMNTRGLMELIALNIGLDMKVISPTPFAMMVLMALVTTMATAPLLQLLMPRASREDCPRAI